MIICFNKLNANGFYNMDFPLWENNPDFGVCLSHKSYHTPYTAGDKIHSKPEQQTKGVR